MTTASPATRLEIAGRELLIVGTAHISQRSIEDVRRVIGEARPDTVCVELDPTRYEALVDDSRWTKLNIFDVIRQKKVLYLLTTIALSAYQRKMGERLGVQPGAELKAAVEMAEQVGARLVLADRDIQATLKRSWAGLSFVEKAKLLELLVVAPFASAEISTEQVEQLKDRDTFNEMLAELAKHMPGLRGPLIDERDQYLMSSIEQAPGSRIVAVVGAGHVAGMLENVGKPVDREALAELPPPSRAKRIGAWLVPVVVLSAFYIGYRQHQGEELSHMLSAWVLPNSVFAGVFTALAGAKPLSVLTAAVASPITSLNPALPSGVVVGLLEAWLRKPTVRDCQRINVDVMSLRGIYRNQFTRVLLVAAASIVGSALGAYVGLGWLVSLLW
jgi:pheromone shutdown-related protein TraB